MKPKTSGASKKSHAFRCSRSFNIHGSDLAQYINSMLELSSYAQSMPGTMPAWPVSLCFARHKVVYAQSEAFARVPYWFWVPCERKIAFFEVSQEMLSYPNNICLKTEQKELSDGLNMYYQQNASTEKHVNNVLASVKALFLVSHLSYLWFSSDWRPFSSLPLFDKHVSGLSRSTKDSPLPNATISPAL